MPDFATLIADLLDDDPIAQTQASLALFDAGRNAVGPLLASLNTTSSPHDGRIITLLGQLQDRRATLPLAEHLSTARQAATRLAVVDALGELDDVRALPALLAALRDDDPRVRVRAVWIVGDYGLPAGRPLLEQCLHDKNDDIARAAALVLASAFRSDAGQALLVQDLHHTDERRILAALEALQPLRTTAAVARLRELVKHPAIAIQRAAINALAPIADTEERALFLQMLRRTTDPDLLSALLAASAASQTAAAVPLLLRRLDDDLLPETRQQMAVTLGQIGDPLAVDRLRQLVDRDIDANVRYQAVLALADIAHPVSIDLVRAYARHDFGLVREAAIKGLGLVRDSESLPLLLERLDGGMRAEAHAAAIAILRINQAHLDAALERIYTDLFHADYEVCWFTLRSLEQYPEPRLSEALYAVLEDDDSSTRELAAGVIGSIGDRTAIPRLTPLLDDVWAVRRRARQALLALGHEFALS